MSKIFVSSMPDPKQAQEVLAMLRKEYPQARYYLDYETPAQLVVAAILSAQMRDEGVNAATKELFKEFKTAKDFAEMSFDEFFPRVANITFAGAKTKNILATCTIIAEKHNNEIPRTVEELVALPGIGEKTAHVILANAYDIVSGIVVDTHVIRISFRLGWTQNKDPKKIETDLRELFPKKDWKSFQWIIKTHGRAVCRAPTPLCSKCPVEKYCPKNGVTKHG